MDLSKLTYFLIPIILTTSLYNKPLFNENEWYNVPNLKREEKIIRKLEKNLYLPKSAVKILYILNKYRKNPTEELYTILTSSIQDYADINNDGKISNTEAKSVQYQWQDIKEELLQEPKDLVGKLFQVTRYVIEGTNIKKILKNKIIEKSLEKILNNTK